jgi:hypothetical protein
MYYPTTRVLTVLELLQARPGVSGGLPRTGGPATPGRRNPDAP